MNRQQKMARNRFRSNPDAYPFVVQVAPRLFQIAGEAGVWVRSNYYADRKRFPNLRVVSGFCATLIEILELRQADAEEAVMLMEESIPWAATATCGACQKTIKDCTCNNSPEYF